MNWTNLKKRFINPVFLLALASGVYQVLAKYGQAPDFGTYQVWVDLASYALLGVGIYSTFEPKNRAAKNKTRQRTKPQSRDV